MSAAPDPSAPILSVRNLSVRIGPHQVLRDVSLSLRPGQVTALVGESGSGKSMTALAMMGLLPDGAQTQGRIDLDGRDLLPLDDRQMSDLRGRRIGMIFQEPMSALNPLMTIGDQVAEVLVQHHAWARDAARKAARARLDRVGLTGDRFPLTLFPHELSGGQRQRVAIAMAIADAPDVLIADEPTTALDVTTQAQIMDLLRGLVAQEGMALLLVTHDLAVVGSVAHRIAVMQDGHVIEEAATADLLRAPRHAHSRALLAASRHQPPREGPTGRDGATILSVEGATRLYPLPRPHLLAPRPQLAAVNDVTFSLRQGESVGLVGESGCGKSTLSRAILGLDPLQGGRIVLDGQPVSARMPAAMRAGIQVVFQDPFGSFDPRWTVDRLVAEPLHLTGRPTDWRGRVAEALAEVGLPAQAMDRHIHEFSGGQRQRIAIARALIVRPRLIVLDEAVSALDVRVRAQVLDLLASLRAAHGLAWLFISHDLSVVRSVTDRVLVMDRGRIVEDGPTAQVLDAPQSAAAQRLAAAAPRLPEAVN